jgi:hypothetical protein
MDGSSLHTTTPDKTEAFLAELTELSARYGMAIGGSPTLYLMERPDYDYQYKIDTESVLTRG